METAANRPLGSKVSMMRSTGRTQGVINNAFVSETAGVWHQHVWHSEDADASSEQPKSSVQCTTPNTKATAKSSAVSWFRRECIGGKLRDVSWPCKENYENGAKVGKAWVPITDSHHYWFFRF